MRRNGKRDANHGDVVGWYKALGCNVLDLANMGEGCPDILVAIDGQLDLVEIKTEKGTLTDPQKEFFRDWTQSKIPIVRTHFDVVHHVGLMRIRAK